MNEDFPEFPDNSFDVPTEGVESTYDGPQEREVVVPPNLSPIPEDIEETKTETHIDRDEIDAHELSSAESDFEEEFLTGTKALKFLGTSSEFAAQNRIPDDDPRFYHMTHQKENSWEPTPIEISKTVESPEQKHKGFEPERHLVNASPPQAILPQRVSALRSKQTPPMVNSPQKSFLSPDSFLINKIMSTPRAVVDGKQMDKVSLKHSLEEKFADLSAITCPKFEDYGLTANCDLSNAQTTLPTLSETGIDRLIKETSLSTSVSDVAECLANLRKRNQRKKTDFSEMVYKTNLSKTIASTSTKMDAIKNKYEPKSSSAPRELLREDAPRPNIGGSTKTPLISKENIITSSNNMMLKPPSLTGNRSYSASSSNRPSNGISIKPSILQFGFVETNTTVKLKVTIKNKLDMLVRIKPFLKRSADAFSLDCSERSLRPNESYDLEIAFSPVRKQGQEEQQKLLFCNRVRILVQGNGHESQEYEVQLNGCSRTACLAIKAPQDHAPLSLRKNGDNILRVSNLEQFSFIMEVKHRAAFAIVDVIDVSGNSIESEIKPSRRIILAKNFPQEISIKVNNIPSRPQSSVSNSRVSLKSVQEEPAFFVRIIWAELISLQRAVLYSNHKKKTIALDGIGLITDRFHGDQNAYLPPPEWPINVYDVETLKTSLRSTRIFVYTDRLASRSFSDLNMTLDETVRPRDFNQTFETTFSRTIIPDPDASMVPGEKCILRS